MHTYNSAEVEQLFSECFATMYNTILVGGADEPEYVPAKLTGSKNLLLYRKDFYASAMHEVAHWCIAGRDRRMCRDFGYWYQSDGRSLKQQIEFEKVEVKPQALECLFAEAVGFVFKPSVDNMAVNNAASTTFLHSLSAQLHAYVEHGVLSENIPKDAKIFLLRLLDCKGGFATQKCFCSHVQLLADSFFLSGIECD